MTFSRSLDHLLYYGVPHSTAMRLKTWKNFGQDCAHYVEHNEESGGVPLENIKPFYTEKEYAAILSGKDRDQVLRNTNAKAEGVNDSSRSDNQSDDSGYDTKSDSSVNFFKMRMEKGERIFGISQEEKEIQETKTEQFTIPEMRKPSFFLTPVKRRAPGSSDESGQTTPERLDSAKSIGEKMAEAWKKAEMDKKSALGRKKKDVSTKKTLQGKKETSPWKEKREGGALICD